MEGPIEGRNDASKTSPLRLGIVFKAIYHDDTDKPWWLTTLEPLVARGCVEVTALWSSDEASTRSLAPALFPGRSLALFWGRRSSGNSGKNGGPNAPTLAALASGSLVDALLLDVPFAEHSPLLSTLFHTPKFDKHVFSTSLPTVTPSTFFTLLEAQARAKRGDRHVVWGVGSPFRYESAVAAMVDLLPDIGASAGAALSGTHIPAIALHPTSQPTTENGSATPDDALLALGFQYTALLRAVLGDASNTCCVKTTTASGATAVSSLAGWVSFANGTQCTIRLTSGSVKPAMDFRVWGSLGHIAVTWDNDKQLFEVQRYLKHFEHPAYHPGSGVQRSLLVWVQTILDQQQQEGNGGRSSLAIQESVDLAVATAMVTSAGSIVGFRPTQLGAAKDNGTTGATHSKRGGKPVLRHQGGRDTKQQTTVHA